MKRSWRNCHLMAKFVIDGNVVYAKNRSQAESLHARTKKHDKTGAPVVRVAVPAGFDPLAHLTGCNADREMFGDSVSDHENMGLDDIGFKD